MVDDQSDVVSNTVELVAGWVILLHVSAESWQCTPYMMLRKWKSFGKEYGRPKSS